MPKTATSPRSNTRARNYRTRRKEHRLHLDLAVRLSSLNQSEVSHSIVYSSFFCMCVREKGNKSSLDLTGQFIKITCTTSTLTQYMVAKSGEATIYMATYTTAEPDIGELRFLARLKSSALPLEYPFGVVSTTNGASSTVEGSDVFVVDGQTRSKFYSSQRFIDDAVVSWHCHHFFLFLLFKNKPRLTFNSTACTAIQTRFMPVFS